jgi:hypothetical protein
MPEPIIYVALLTELQKESLIGQLYTDDSYYHPIQDADNNWVISTEEVDFTTTEEFIWVKDLPLIVYNEKIAELTGFFSNNN